MSWCNVVCVVVVVLLVPVDEVKGARCRKNDHPFCQPRYAYAKDYYCRQRWLQTNCPKMCRLCFTPEKMVRVQYSRRVVLRNINECMRNNGGCSQRCINTQGSYRCECRNGYKLGWNKRTCIDINECLRHNGGCSHHCTNRRGSCSCGCPSGYTLNSDRKNCDERYICQWMQGASGKGSREHLVGERSRSGCIAACIKKKGGRPFIDGVNTWYEPEQIAGVERRCTCCSCIESINEIRRRNDRATCNLYRKGEEEQRINMSEGPAGSMGRGGTRADYNCCV